MKKFFQSEIINHNEKIAINGFLGLSYKKIKEFKRFFDQILWQIHFLNIDFKSEVFELKCFRVYF